jgi:hypothetical protein
LHRGKVLDFPNLFLKLFSEGGNWSVRPYYESSKENLIREYEYYIVEQRGEIK